MGKILDILGLPYAQKIEALKEIDTSVEPIEVYSAINWKVRFKGKYYDIKQGLHKYSPGFALFILDKYGPNSKYGQTFNSAGKGKPVKNPVLLDYDPNPKKKPEPKADKS